MTSARAILVAVCSNLGFHLSVAMLPACDWYLSCLAVQTRRCWMTAYPRLPLAVWVVACLAVFSLANAWACEWYSGCLCRLAPCLCIERSACNPLKNSPYSVVPMGFDSSSCVAYLLKGTRVACWTFAIPSSLVGSWGLWKYYVCANSVMLHGDYFGVHVLTVLLDAVHEVNMGCFSHCVP